MGIYVEGNTKRALKVLKRYKQTEGILKEVKRNSFREKLFEAKRREARDPQEADPHSHRIAELEKENEKLKTKLKQAELIIDVQKKVAELLKGSSEEKS